MTQVLNKVRDVDPNNSDAVKDVLVTFFQTLPKHKELDSYRWLRALENIITRFPKYCMSHRTTIETHLVHFLDSSNYHNVIEAAKCAHALQQVRPSHEKTATAKSCWGTQMNLLCEAAHKLIGAMFPQAVDIYKHSKKSKKDAEDASSPLSAALLRINSVTKTQKNSNIRAVLATRLRNVFVFLQAMLVEVYPVAKLIRPQTILDVMMRALSVSSGKAAGNQTSSDVIMVKTQALRSLDALVACLGPNLIPFSPLVFRFVMQTLKWSSDNPNEESCKVRCTAYNSLSRWLTILHTRPSSDSRARCWEDELTTHVIDDVTPTRHTVQLTMSAQPTKHLSKKAKRKMANSMLLESNMASHMPGEKNKISVSEEVNDEVAIAALECAETFLTVCGIFLKPTTHKLFQERLVRECYNLSSYSLDRSIALLRALEASRKGTPPGLPPPTQYCLHLYSVMVSREHSQVSKFCSQALMDIRLHLHCSPPSLNFAIEMPSEELKKADEKKKQISERNRATLEALLGADKMPTNEEKEELITITDEPSNKKRRLEDEITDKISVSSESEVSIEISDESEEDVCFVHEVIEKTGTDEQSNVERSEEKVVVMQIDELDGNNVTKIEANEVRSDIEATNESVGTNEITTQTGKENDDKVIENINIYEAETQMPLNISNDTEADESSPAMEIVYDYQNTGKEKVTQLEKTEEEYLPSTNDSDDIQITCGQDVKYSQSENSEVKLIADVPKVNGMNKSTKVVENGISENVGGTESNVTAKDSNEVSVEDMLADFVDEVNEDTPVNTAA